MVKPNKTILRTQSGSRHPGNKLMDRLALLCSQLLAVLFFLLLPHFAAQVSSLVTEFCLLSFSARLWLEEGSCANTVPGAR